MVRCAVLAGDRGQRKTHDRCRPWVLVEMALNATSPDGIGGYDDNPQIENLQRK